MLSDEEREALAEDCACGHPPDNHGSLAGCWDCLEENRRDDACRRTFMALVGECVGRIVAARVEAAERCAARRAWEQGWAVGHHHDNPINPYIRWEADSEACSGPSAASEAADGESGADEPQAVTEAHSGSGSLWRGLQQVRDGRARRRDDLISEQPLPQEDQ